MDPRSLPATSSRSRTAIVVLLSGALLVLFFLELAPATILIQRIGFPLILALAEIAAALGAGTAIRLLLGKILRSKEPALPSVAFDILCGAPLFGTICYLVALVHVGRTVSFLLISSGIALAAWVWRGYARAGERIALDLAGAFALIVLALSGGIAFLLAQAPSISLDELAYHLAVPKTWVLEGRAVELPLNSHSYFPFGLESVDLLSLSILGDQGAIASHLFHLMLSAAVISLMFQWLRRYGSTTVALLAAAAAAATPALLITAGWSWNDWLVCGLGVAVLYAVHEIFTTERQGATPQLALALAAGLLTKYTFALFALAALAAAMIACRRNIEQLSILKKAGLAGTILGSVFFIRNLFLTGNPFAPFLSSLTPHVAGFRTSLPGYIFDSKIVDEALGLSLIIPVVGMIAAWRFLPLHLREMALALGISTGLLLLARPSSRILLPFLVSLVAISFYAIERLGSPAKGLLFTGTLASCLVQLAIVGLYVGKLDPLATFGRMSDETYVRANREAFNDIAWTNAHLPAGSRTLIIGINELFWYSHRVRGGGNFDHPRIAAYLGGSSDAIRTRLVRDGVSHVAVYPRRILRRGPVTAKAEERMTALDDVTVRNLQEMLAARAEIIGSSETAILYALK